MKAVRCRLQLAEVGDMSNFSRNGWPMDPLWGFTKKFSECPDQFCDLSDSSSLHSVDDLRSDVNKCRNKSNRSLVVKALGVNKQTDCQTHHHGDSFLEKSFLSGAAQQTENTSFPKGAVLRRVQMVIFITLSPRRITSSLPAEY